MTRDIVLRRLFRGAAILIAIAAAIDPVVTSDRSTRPNVSVIAVDPRHDSALTTRVARTLGSAFTVTTAPFAIADATVLVGDGLPASTGELAQPVFAVTSDHGNPIVAIDTVDTPVWAPLDTRVPVRVAVRTVNENKGRIMVTLRQNGVVVDQITDSITSDAQRSSLLLTFLPTSPGLSRLQVTATSVGRPSAGDSSRVDAAVDIRDQRWAVLFYDARPSWLATFVRRAAERDSRLAVASRTVTSRAISIASGKPPAGLDNLTSVDNYDAIVIGAPDALTDRDVSGLEAFMRQHGGSVVLLLDQRVDGPWQRLASTGTWLDNRSGRLMNIASAPGAPSLKAAELAWPAHLPVGAEAIAFTFGAAGDTAARHPVIWRSPIGAGSLVVSGALDSWRYRDSTVSAFDRYWRDLIAQAASSARPPLQVLLSQSLAAPGETIELSVTARDAALHPLPVSASVAATIESTTGAGRTAIRLWPTGSVGELRGVVRAPSLPGTYRIVASANGIGSETPLLVTTNVAHRHVDDREMLGAWVTAHGGQVVPATQLTRLPAVIGAGVRASAHRERWHPLRSAWWLLPFALALSGEWWLRRRRGLA